MGGKNSFLTLLLVLSFSAAPLLSEAAVTVQCPGDANGDAVPDAFVNGRANPDYRSDVKCMHIAAGDGYITMADGSPMYIFGFSDATGLPSSQVLEAGVLAATFPAPTITLDEGDKFYLTLTNVGLFNRPDLFDPHSVHWHGFPQAASIYDGVPEASMTPNMGGSYTYFYNTVEPGTYMYHCHVEAAEHMQMGMLGNLYVRPAQNRLPGGTSLNGFTHLTGYKYAYNDGDGTTHYDIDYPVQISSFDSAFHASSMTVQPLAFAYMRDDYGMINGRGYPDTLNPNPLTPPLENNGKYSQNMNSLITAKKGQKVLLRISNLSITRFFTLNTTGISMKVVGKDSRLLRGPGGQNLYYDTNSVTLGGGESVDVIIDTAQLAEGTYFLYTGNLHYLSNKDEDFGGIMTEIVINPA